ncbi:universal stress protein [Pseudonocardia acaciae]|uniref:universal stress protein n=1 Tax=Pseudonocardia acaciae TaxID=551276 RepID=UPI00068825E3|nr:universal stress protein [Pseudonocardia acaciae]
MADTPGLVVVGVDGSLSSRAALRHAVREATWRRAALRVVSAYEPPELWALAYGEPFPAGGSGVADAVRAETQRVIDAALGGDPDEPKTELMICPGSAGPTLVAAARDADLLVVGHRGRGYTRMPLGSVALYCVLHATCPVTVVRPGSSGDAAGADEPARAGLGGR